MRIGIVFVLIISLLHAKPFNLNIQRIEERPSRACRAIFASVQSFDEYLTTGHSHVPIQRDLNASPIEIWLASTKMTEIERGSRFLPSET
jgi:hypothetical protein